jgi:hypothetical protein
VFSPGILDISTISAILPKLLNLLHSMRRPVNIEQKFRKEFVLLRDA